MRSETLGPWGHHQLSSGSSKRRPGSTQSDLHCCLPPGGLCSSCPLPPCYSGLLQTHMPYSFEYHYREPQEAERPWGRFPSCLLPNNCQQPDDFMISSVSINLCTYSCMVHESQKHKELLHDSDSSHTSVKYPSRCLYCDSTVASL